ncbi:castor zinc finger transcription factor [Musca autumnalis]|uniref:castor zinc finger transcription factor n=1 Tax=Musca autumnalis TaxID=221902 RepID=UPI003CEBAC91
MSTQLEFIMQLYMMNLLQQQQQQQQQLQQNQLQQQHQQQPFALSPVKAKDLDSTPTTTTPLLRTQKRKLSQNTNTTTSSSSRSCSPNSNLSPQLPLTATNSYPAPVTQFSLLQQQQQQLLLQQQQQQQPQSQALNPMLLNNLPALTQFMLMQQQAQQQQQQITSSNLLLTPTTPNSSNNSSSLSCTNPSSMAGNYLGNSFGVYGAGSTATAGFLPGATPPLSSAPAAASTASLFFPSSSSSAFPAQNSSSFIASSPSHNFLQSSTVTSTPMANANKIPAVGNSFNVNAGVDVHNVEGDVEEEEDDVKIIKTEQLDNDEDGIHHLANSTSGLRPLELTADSMEDSKHMPFTPEKSSYCGGAQQPLVDNDASNVTPLTLKNAILTPPSSEQLSSKPGSATFEGSSSSTGGCGGAINKSSSTSSNSSGTTANLTGSTCSVSATGVDSFLTEENLKHLRKNSSYLECENALCRQENLREHFHCYEEPCQGKILSKKDDIIRHLKWHKKRKESLLLGFARFSSSDDCAPEYGAGCAYNWKQTHYHCIYEECPKVYVSTSDVQMHANFHRKNSEIVQEGFRRFRAHENCKIEECPFYGKKTSHYHCCREGCNHTFKNKADMEKHKVYHMKDHQLTQDGFKKILKTEKCPFDDCKYSCVSNHIHCVRENCNYILHSSTQMISHKRKHDRAEGEQNYQQFKTQRDSSEEESPSNTVATAATATTGSVKSLTSNTSTPLSSLSAEHFLARKRGRPPKKIQLPSESSEAKRIKLEAAAADSNSNSSIPNTTSSTVNTSLPAPTNPLAATMPLMNPFMANFNPAAVAGVDPNAPNFQLTHLMALFQLQNPLFYQNLYPRGITAANMANILGAANLPAGNTTPNTTSATNVKQELNEKQEFKE